jgi:hypothetical protein
MITIIIAVTLFSIFFYFKEKRDRDLLDKE